MAHEKHKFLLLYGKSHSYVITDMPNTYVGELRHNRWLTKANGVVVVVVVLRCYGKGDNQGRNARINLGYMMEVFADGRRSCGR